MDDILGRTLNPGVILTMILTGIAYGHFLWALELRPVARLYAAAVIPGAIFVLTILDHPLAPGNHVARLRALFIDWLIFAHSGFAAVLVARRWRAR